MQTRSSPPQSEDGNNITIEPVTGSKPRCDWSEKDEIELINFLIEHKAEAGDSATFKSVVWNAASQLLEKSRVKGGPKTSKACSDKWTRVCRTALDDGTVTTHPPSFFIAQGDLQHNYRNQDLWFTLVQ